MSASTADSSSDRGLALLTQEHHTQVMVSAGPASLRSRGSGPAPCTPRTPLRQQHLYYFHKVSYDNITFVGSFTLSPIDCRFYPRFPRRHPRKHRGPCPHSCTLGVLKHALQARYSISRQGCGGVAVWRACLHFLKPLPKPDFMIPMHNSPFSPLPSGVRQRQGGRPACV